MKNKKAQEEIVGFVAIIVLAAVAFVIFLFFSLNSNSQIQEKEGHDIKNFLESARQYTTSCSLSEPDFASLKELMGYCYSDLTCISGQSSCTLLEDTLQEILTASVQVGEEFPTKGYQFKIIYAESDNHQESILELEEGNCSSQSYREADDFFPQGIGKIKYILRKCF